MLKHKESFGIRMLTFLIGMLLPLCVSAQQINVQGTVKDAVGSVPGASVIVKGTTNGTIADIDGKFSMKVPAGAVLEVSTPPLNKTYYKVGERIYIQTYPRILIRKKK